MLIKKQKHQQQIGATGVIIILIMIVLLTIGISVFTNTARDVAITTQTEESVQVFHAAESGVENALSQIYEAEQANSDVPEGDFTISDEDNQIVYTIAKKNILDMIIPEGETIEIPLSGLGAGSTVDVYWAETAEDCASREPAALLIIVYSATGPTLVQNYAVDGCNQNNFQTTGAGSGGYKFQYQITVPANARIARIQPLFNDTRMKIEGLADVTQYGILSRSETAGAGEEAQSILVERTLPSAPSFMNYSLVSGANIIK